MVYPPTTSVTDAVGAALERAAIYCYGTEPTTDVLPIDGALVSAGLVKLAGAMLQESMSPTGVIESDQFTGPAMAAEALSICHDYFDHLRTVGSYGIA